MPIQTHALTHPGSVRTENEDRNLIDSELNLAIVSDGNKHPRGAHCSELVCKGIQRFLKENRRVIDAHEKSGNSSSRSTLVELIRHAIETVSSTLYLETQASPEMKGAFATACLALISRDYVFIGHLGDSRAYSIRGDTFQLLTRDHTYLTALLSEGKSVEDASRVSYAGNLSAAMGYQPVARASVQVRELSPEERLLLCTDGLSDLFGHNSFRSPEWATLSSAKLPEALKGHALTQKTRDNLTAIVIDPTQRKKERTQATPDVLNKFGTVRGIRLFQHLGERSLMKFLSLTDLRELAQGQELIHRGGILDEMYILLSGELSIDLGQGPISATVKKGEVVGEMSLFEGSLPSATLVALKPTTLLALHRDQLFQAMREDVEFAARFELGVLQAVIRRLRERTEPDEELKSLQNYSVVSILPPEHN